jgi:hypothetical protein
VERASDRIVAERKLSVEGVWPSAGGGQGSKALSVPMREDSPAARMTPAKLTDRDMVRKIAESREKVSDQKATALTTKGTKTRSSFVNLRALRGSRFSIVD